MQKEDRLYAALLCKFSKGIGNIKGAKILSDPAARARLYDCDAKIHERVRKEVESIHKKRILTTTLLDEDYPQSLRNIHDAPLILYYYGTLPKGFSFAVVGTRSPSKYGITTTQLIVSQLAEFCIPIVSGFAYGIDAIAHQVALENKIPTIAVLGTGIDVRYPLENTWMRSRIVELGGCILTEFPLDVKAHPGNFPTRNRIISGLSNGILVVEATSRSGSLITAQLGLDQGKNIFTIPGTVFGESFKGNHNLVRMGATLVENGYQILSEYPEFQTLVGDKEGHQNPGYKDMQALQQTNVKEKRASRTSFNPGANIFSSLGETEFPDGTKEVKQRALQKELSTLDDISTLIYHGIDKPRTLEEIMAITRLQEPGKVLSTLTQLMLKGLVEEKGGIYYLSD